MASLLTRWINRSPRASEPDGEVERAEDLPVVARLVVEIRSDGTRTIARGAIEDRTIDQTVAVEARAGSPWELSKSLVKMLLAAPGVAARIVRKNGS